MLKAVLLYSGGLDSMLTVRIMQQQDCELIPVQLHSCFFPLRKSCEEGVGIKPLLIEVTEDFIPIVRSPKYGYGRLMNPCIDCRISMYRKAKSIMEQEKAAFIVTGEVVGQRPMTQFRRQLTLMEQEAGLTGMILRPLSARCLPQTVFEKNGLIDRKRLFSFTGRGRKQQMALAAQLGLDRYPSPAGGCRLCDETYARRLKELFLHSEETLRNVKLLSIGRHFRLPCGAKLTVGRDERENARLEQLVAEGDLVMEAVDFVGPTAILTKSAEKSDIRLAASLVGRYSDGKDEKRLKIRIRRSGSTEEVEVKVAEAATPAEFRI